MEEVKEQQPQLEGAAGFGTVGELPGARDEAQSERKAPEGKYAPWDDLDQEEQNERNRAAILALADALGGQANVAPVRELLA